MHTELNSGATCAYYFQIKEVGTARITPSKQSTNTTEQSLQKWPETRAGSLQGEPGASYSAWRRESVQRKHATRSKEPASGLSARDHWTWFLCKRRILNHRVISPRPQTLNWKATPYMHVLHHRGEHTRMVYHLCCLHYQSSPKVPGVRLVTNFFLVYFMGTWGEKKKAPRTLRTNTASAVQVPIEKKKKASRKATGGNGKVKLSVGNTSLKFWWLSEIIYKIGVMTKEQFSK